jgi:CubicO group peptidase (beta-lactamase class C family)
MKNTSRYFLKKRQFFFNLLLILIASQSVAQLNETQLKKIDDLFTEWNSTTPGCVVGIVRNDSLLFSKGYGMANLETGTPNTPETVCMLASCSKQFTAYCIVLLVKQGRVNLDEDIHTYLPWFPDMKAKITVRNLLNHTSGIRDELILLLTTGTRWDDEVTQEDVIRLMKRQQTLNFKPGERYLYSNSNYTLLGEIVKAVSHQSLRVFVDSAIFKPLQMTHTLLSDNTTEILKNRSDGYGREQEGKPFLYMPFNSSSVGSSNIYSTIGDLGKWMNNFYNPKVGDATDIALLTNSKPKLANGETSNYAFGILNYKYKGINLYEHEGRQNGYVAQMLVFPDLKMGVFICGNFRDFQTKKKAFDVADLFIPRKGKKEEQEEEEVVDSSKAFLEDPAVYKKYTGNYMNEQGVVFSIKILNNKLYVESEGDLYLLQVKKETAIPVTEPQFKFKFEIKNNDTLLHQKWASGSRTLKKYRDATGYSIADLQNYVGTYYCEELDCSYGIILQDHELVLTHRRHEDSKLSMIGSNDLFSDDNWWMHHLKITRDDQNKITGFMVEVDRVSGLKFIKKE